MSRTLRLLCCTAAEICIGLSASVATAQSPVCEQSPIEDRWPEVIGPMIGQSPAWLVDGVATWVKDEPVKTAGLPLGNATSDGWLTPWKA